MMVFVKFYNKFSVATSLLCLLFFLISCSDNSTDLSVQSVNQNELRIDLDDITPEEATIDTSDLSFLPKDDGSGEHKAFPHKTTSSPHGYYAYTPSDYLNNDYEYPLLIFLHGWDSESVDSSINPDDLDNVLDNGPPLLIRTRRWNPNYPFIVVSPQLIEEYWNYEKIHSFIEYLMDTYKVNENRIYITGLSLGGGGAWHYVGEMGDKSYAAAIVPICASYYPSTAENYKNTPVWAFHGSLDATVDPFENGGSVTMVEAINEINPVVRAKITMYPGVGHNSWSRTYNGLGQGSEDRWYNKFDKSIYDWMLQYKKE